MEFIFLPIHILSLCVAGVGILVADKSAFAWLRGKKQTISTQVIFISHWVVTGGLAGLILSGLVLFWPRRDYLVMEPFFWTKMAFVAALVINSFVIEYLMHHAAARSFASLSKRERIPFYISGAVSTISWIGAALIGLLFF
jgi:hypothetical protein